MNFRLSLLLLLAGLWGCAAKTPARTAGKAQRPCTLTDTSGCPQKKTRPRAGDDGEVRAFYEGVAENGLKDETEADGGTVETVIGEEVEAEIGKTDIESVPKFDIPIVMNKQVEKWIDYFQHRGRKFFASWLSRSEKYIPLMKGILRENGLPEDLIYLAMIESGFKPYAYSRAKASGPWQFIKTTGTLYGLKVNWWIDERRDPEKSSIAAAQHLKDLYDQFNSWYLAAAGYNAGAGKISKAIRRYSTEDFWEMSKQKHGYLKPETKNYVPKMIAAAMIAKEPERYGFTDIVYDEPLQYEKVGVPEPTELTAIAEGLQVDVKLLVELNPELKRNVTPPNYPNYELKLPKGYSQKFAECYPEIRRNTVSRVVRHIVKKRETLESIAAEYGVASETLVVFNRMKSHSVRRGQQLAVPVRLPSSQPLPAEVREVRRAVYKAPSRRLDTYTVRSGDTLWSISRRFDVSAVELRKWNRLSSSSSLKPGSNIKLYARTDPPMLEPSTQAKWKTYRVQKGDSLWTIAKRNGVKISDLVKWNELDPEGPSLRPGSELKIRSFNL